MSDSNPIAVLERTSLIVYKADIFNFGDMTHVKAGQTGSGQ